MPERDEELQILQRHADGFDPHDLAAAGVRAVAGAARRRARPRPPYARWRCPPEVAGYVVDIARATRVSPSLSLGVSPRGATALLRTSRAWAWLQGRAFVTPDDVKALAGATLAHRLGLRPEAELEGVAVDARCCRARSTRCPCRDDASPAGCRCCCCSGVSRSSSGPPASTAAWWVLAVAAAGRRGRAARAAARAGSSSPAVRSARSGRARPRRPRCWWPTAATAGCRGLLRDAWQPSAGATGNRHRLDLAAGDQVLAAHLADARPGAATGAPHRVTVRCTGPLGLAGPAALASTCPAGCGCCRRSTPASTCPAGWPGCASSTAARRSGSAARAPSSTRCATTCCGDDVRSIDWRASARSRNVVVRTWQPERHRRVLLVLDTSRTSAGRVDDVPRLDSAMDAALLLAALASRAGDSVDFLAGDRQVRARVRAGAPRRRAAPRWSRRWPTSSRRSSRPTGRGSPRPWCRSAGSPRSSCCSPPSSRRPSSTACCRRCPRSPTGTGWCWPRCATRSSTGWRPARRRRQDGLRRGGRRAGAGRPGPHRRDPGRLGVDVVDADADEPAGGADRPLPDAEGPRAALSCQRRPVSRRPRRCPRAGRPPRRRCARASAARRPSTNT